MFDKHKLNVSDEETLDLSCHETLGDSSFGEGGLLEGDLTTDSTTYSQIFEFRRKLKKIDQVVALIDRYRSLIAASFTGVLGDWVDQQKKLSESDCSRLSSISQSMVQAINHSRSIDVRKAFIDKKDEVVLDINDFPCALACFIDAVIGINIENSNIKLGDMQPDQKNKLLRQFLFHNDHILDCLAKELPRLEFFAGLWNEHCLPKSPKKTAAVLSKSMCSALSPAKVLPSVKKEKSSKRSLPSGDYGDENAGVDSSPSKKLSR